ncbi:MAG: Uma2 family endonuclease [Caldilineaceae bacterium]
MSALPKLYLSPEQYLVQERKSLTKHEYYAGEIFALAGASRQHNLIVLNVGAELRTQLKKRSCTVYPSDLRVKIEPIDLYTYPDVVVVCGKAQFDDKEQDTLLNPTVIVEVLSKSTEAYDRGTKFKNYRTLPSLTEYILIAQDAYHIEHYVRQTDNQWLLSEVDDPEGVVELPTIQCSLLLGEVYDKVEFAPEADAQHHG